MMLIKLSGSGLIEASVNPAPETEDLYVGFLSSDDVPKDATHYRNGEFLTKPQQPSPSHKWNDAAFVWELDTNLAWIDVRATRSRLLASSDWTQLPDVPLSTKEAWAAYRQALRDITNQTDPFNIVWPVAP